MARAEEATASGGPPGRGRSSVWRSWKAIAILGVLVAATLGGAAYWYLYLRPPMRAATETVAKPELPLPFYLEVKPFVVSIVNSGGAPHFVQMGVNLALSGSEAGNALTAILPEVQDAMRQTAVAFKVDDIVTPAGIDKLRQAMVTNANRALLQRLGSERVERLAGGDPNGAVIQNIYFTTLIVE